MFETRTRYWHKGHVERRQHGLSLYSFQNLSLGFFFQDILKISQLLASVFVWVIVRLSMTFTPDGERQSSLLIFNSFLVISNKSYKNRKVSLTIHWKYKYFDSTVQRAEDRRQKFHFCRLPSAVNVMLNLSIGTKAMLSDVNTAFRWNPALRLNTHPSPPPHEDLIVDFAPTSRHDRLVTYLNNFNLQSSRRIILEVDLLS